MEPTAAAVAAAAAAVTPVDDPVSSLISHSVSAAAARQGFLSEWGISEPEYASRVAKLSAERAKQQMSRQHAQTVTAMMQSKASAAASTVAAESIPAVAALASPAVASRSRAVPSAAAAASSRASDLFQPFASASKRASLPGAERDQSAASTFFPMPSVGAEFISEHFELASTATTNDAATIVPRAAETASDPRLGGAVLYAPTDAGQNFRRRHSQFLAASAANPPAPGTKRQLSRMSDWSPAPQASNAAPVAARALGNLSVAAAPSALRSSEHALSFLAAGDHLGASDVFHSEMTRPTAIKARQIASEVTAWEQDSVALEEEAKREDDMHAERSAKLERNWNKQRKALEAQIEEEKRLEHNRAVAAAAAAAAATPTTSGKPAPLPKPLVSKPVHVIVLPSAAAKKKAAAGKVAPTKKTPRKHTTATSSASASSAASSAVATSQHLSSLTAADHETVLAQIESHRLALQKSLTAHELDESAEPEDDADNDPESSQPQDQADITRMAESAFLAKETAFGHKVISLPTDAAPGEGATAAAAAAAVSSGPSRADSPTQQQQQARTSSALSNFSNFSSSSKRAALPVVPSRVVPLDSSLHSQLDRLLADTAREKKEHDRALASLQIARSKGKGKGSNRNNRKTGGTATNNAAAAAGLSMVPGEFARLAAEAASQPTLPAAHAMTGNLTATVPRSLKSGRKSGTFKATPGLSPQRTAPVSNQPTLGKRSSMPGGYQLGAAAPSQPLSPRASESVAAPPAVASLVDATASSPSDSAAAPLDSIPLPRPSSPTYSSASSISTSSSRGSSRSLSSSPSIELLLRVDEPAAAAGVSTQSPCEQAGEGVLDLSTMRPDGPAEGGAENSTRSVDRSVSFPSDAARTTGGNASTFASKLKNVSSKPKSPSSSAAASANLAVLSAVERKAKRADRAEAAAKVRAEIERKRVADMEQVAATSGVTAAAAASASAAAAALALLPPPPNARGSRAPSVIMQSITSPADDHDSIGRRLIALSSYASASGSANPSPPPEKAERGEPTSRNGSEKDQVPAISSDDPSGSSRVRRPLKLRPAGAPKSFVLPMRSLESKLLNAGIGVLNEAPPTPQSPALSTGVSPRMGRMNMGNVSPSQAQSQLSSSPPDHRSGASTPGGGGQRTLTLPFSPSFTAAPRLSPSPTPTAVAASLSAFMDPGSATELSHSSSLAGGASVGTTSPSSSTEPASFVASTHSPSRLFGFSTPIQHLKSLMASNQEMQAAQKQEALIRHMQQEEQIRQQQQQQQQQQSQPPQSSPSRRTASTMGTAAPPDDTLSAGRSTSLTPTSADRIAPSYKGSASPVLISVHEAGEAGTRLSSDPADETVPASSSFPATSSASVKKKQVRIVDGTLPLHAVPAGDGAAAANPTATAAAAPSSVSPPKPSRRTVRSRSINEPTGARRRAGKSAADSTVAGVSPAASDALSRRRSSGVETTSAAAPMPARRPRRSFVNSGANLPGPAQQPKGPPPNLAFASPPASSVEPSLAEALARVAEDNRSPRQRTAFSHQRVDADRYGNLGTATPQQPGSASQTRRSSNVPGAPVAPSPPLSQRDSGVVDRLLAPIQRRPARVPSTTFIPVRTDLSEWEHLSDATSSLHASPEIMIRSIDTIAYDSNSSSPNLHLPRRVAAVAPPPPPTVQLQQFVEPEPEPNRASETEVETEADSELDSDARSTSGRDSANPREAPQSSSAAGALSTISSPAIQFAIAPQEEIDAEIAVDVLAPQEDQPQGTVATQVAGKAVEPNSTVEQTMDAAPIDAQAVEDPQLDEAHQEQLEMQDDEAQSKHDDAPSEVSPSQQQQQQPADDAEVDALTLEIIRDLATVAAMPAPAAHVDAGSDATIAEGPEEEEFRPSSVRFEDDHEQGDAAAAEQPDPVDFRGSPLPPQHSSEEVMRAPPGFEGDPQFEQPPPGSSKGRRGRRGGEATGRTKQKHEGYFASARTASRPSIERGTSRTSSDGYTGILDVVQLHARRLARRKIQASKPLVRQLLAEAMERERLARETDEWIRRHADQEAEGRGVGDDDGGEERKDGSSSPFKPSRANATIMPAATPSGPGAPKVAGALAARSDRGGEVSAQRAMQMAREQRHAAQAAARAEPRFIAPSSNPLFTREFLSTKLNPHKPPLPVHVASASFCFYTTAEEAPIQLEFAREPEGYPRPHDHTANQQRPPAAHAATSMITSPRHNRTVLHATTTTTTTQHQHTVASHAAIHGSQTARVTRRDAPPPDSALPLSASGSPRASHPPAVPAWSHVDPSAFDGTDHVHRPSVPFHASLPNSPSPVMGRPGHSGAGTQMAYEAATTVTAAAAAAPAASLPSVSQLSASLLSHSSYLPSLSVDSRPIFPSFHAFKSTLRKKNANVDAETQQHAHQHVHGDTPITQHKSQRKA